MNSTTEPMIEIIISPSLCCLFVILNPIYTGEFYLRRRHCKSTLTTPSAGLVARVLVVLCLSFAGVVNSKLVELVRSLRGFEMSLSLH